MPEHIDLPPIVWLDLDDTIVDFHANSHRALQRLWAEDTRINRLFPTTADWIDCYEHHNTRLWQQYSAGLIERSYLRTQRFILPLTQAGMPLSEASAYAAEWDVKYLDILAQERQLIPGSMDLLRHLKDSGVTIGCLSNGFQDVQYRKIRNCGLEPWFDIVVLSDHIGVNKPDIRLFRHAMKVTDHHNPADHLMIGDNILTDISGALHAGWQAIYFRRTTSFPEAPYGATEVNTLAEIISLTAPAVTP